MKDKRGENGRSFFFSHLDHGGIHQPDRYNYYIEDRKTKKNKKDQTENVIGTTSK